MTTDHGTRIANAGVMLDSILLSYFAAIGFYVHVLRLTEWVMDDTERFVIRKRAWRARLWPPGPTDTKRPRLPDDVDRAA